MTGAVIHKGLSLGNGSNALPGQEIVNGMRWVKWSRKGVEILVVVVWGCELGLGGGIPALVWT